jgi:hypothetical protein
MERHMRIAQLGRARHGHARCAIARAQQTCASDRINRFVGEISADRKPVVWPALAPSPLSSAASKVLESVQ